MIKKINFGKHQNVLIAEFGTGDICFTKAMFCDEKQDTLLLFSNNTDARKIGEVSNDVVGQNSDDLPAPEFVFRFTKPESITALIHSLVELQKEVFEYDKSHSVRGNVLVDFLENQKPLIPEPPEPPKGRLLKEGETY